MAEQQMSSPGFSWEQVKRDVDDAFKSIIASEMTSRQLHTQRITAQSEYLKSVGLMAAAAAQLAQNDALDSQNRFNKALTTINDIDNQIALYRGFSDSSNKNYETMQTNGKIDMGRFVKALNALEYVRDDKDENVFYVWGKLQYQNNPNDKSGIAYTIKLDPATKLPASVVANKDYVGKNGKAPDPIGAFLLQSTTYDPFGFAVKPGVGDMKDTQVLLLTGLNRKYITPFINSQIEARTKLIKDAQTQFNNDLSGQAARTQNYMNMLIAIGQTPNSNYSNPWFKKLPALGEMFNWPSGEK